MIENGKLIGEYQQQALTLEDNGKIVIYPENMPLREWRQNREFEVNKLSSEEIEVMEIIRNNFDFLLNNLIGILDAEMLKAYPIEVDGMLRTLPSEAREFRIVRTKLEEACFFAKKAFATSRFSGMIKPSDPTHQSIKLRTHESF